MVGGIHTHVDVVFLLGSSIANFEQLYDQCIRREGTSLETEVEAGRKNREGIYCNAAQKMGRKFINFYFLMKKQLNIGTHRSPNQYKDILCTYAEQPGNSF